MFCTWGAMDLTELQRNLRYYGLDELLSGPIRYYDAQKLFSMQFDEKKKSTYIRICCGLYGARKATILP